VNYVDEEMLYWMKKAGCIQISYGIESGSEKIRKALNKNINTEDIKRAFTLTTGYGILARAYFIYGSPGESWKTIEDTLDIIHSIKPLSIIFYILDIFPGTALYEDFKKRTGLDDDVWLQRIEDIMYFESDPGLTQEKILAFGKKLKSDYYQHLPRFADSVRVLELDDLREEYADFFSRLAMTFSHGDYATIDAISDKEIVAERLYTKSLLYAPNQRAYLGLGIIRQKQGRHEESVQILSEGIQQFPSNESLGICLAISLMNLGRYEEALLSLHNFPHSPDALKYTATCYHELGQYEKELSVITILKNFPTEGHSS
jgi:tetratricopeptide (TPR) repeat protein